LYGLNLKTQTKAGLPTLAGQHAAALCFAGRQSGAVASARRKRATRNP